MSGTRKDPLRIRRKSTKEFSRVLQLIKKIMDKNSAAISKIEVRLNALEGKKRKRGRPPKKAEE